MGILYRQVYFNIVGGKDCSGNSVSNEKLQGILCLRCTACLQWSPDNLLLSCWCKK